MISEDLGPYKTVLSLAKARYSCRAFEPRPVPMCDIQRVLEVARTAPSDCNTQPANMFIVSGRALDGLRAEMYEAASSGLESTSDVPPIAAYAGVFQDRRRECGWELYNAVGIERGDREGSGRQALENFRFFGAPHLAVVTVDKDLAERGLFDAGIYLSCLPYSLWALRRCRRGPLHTARTLFANMCQSRPSFGSSAELPSATP